MAAQSWTDRSKDRNNNQHADYLVFLELLLGVFLIGGEGLRSGGLPVAGVQPLQDVVKVLQEGTNGGQHQLQLLLPVRQPFANNLVALVDVQQLLLGLGQV